MNIHCQNVCDNEYSLSQHCDHCLVTCSLPQCSYFRCQKSLICKWTVVRNFQQHLSSNVIATNFVTMSAPWVVATNIVNKHWPETSLCQNVPTMLFTTISLSQHLWPQIRNLFIFTKFLTRKFSATKFLPWTDRNLMSEICNKIFSQQSLSQVLWQPSLTFFIVGPGATMFFVVAIIVTIIVRKVQQQFWLI